LVDYTLKGKEMKLPNDLTFHDKDGHKRDEIRIKWWEDGATSSLKDYSVLPIKNLPDVPSQSTFDYYKADNKPVFFGHYWMTGKPILQKSNVCCLDYSIAEKGSLVAYRWSGESILDERNFKSVK
jgi:hypothetical protein